MHIGNFINRPPRQNDPMFRVQTSFILKVVECFRKYMSTKSWYGALGSIGNSRSIQSMLSLVALVEFVLFTVI